MLVHAAMVKKLHGLSTFGAIEVEEQTFLQGRQWVRAFSTRAGVKYPGHSGPLPQRITDFGAEESVVKAARQLKEHYGLEVVVGAIRGLTEAHGERLLRAPQILQGVANADEVEQFIAETDGNLIPKVEVDETSAGDRRKTRQVGWKEARLSLVYAQGSVQPVFGVTTGSPEQTGAQLAACAKRVGFGVRTQVHGIGDGALWITEQMEWIFDAQGHYLIDFYPLCDYLAAASKRRATDGQAGYETQKARMKAGAKEEVLNALAPHLEPPQVHDNEAPVRACNRCIRNRPDQFDYPRVVEGRKRRHDVGTAYRACQRQLGNLLELDPGCLIDQHFRLHPETTVNLQM